MNHQGRIQPLFFMHHIGRFCALLGDRMRGRAKPLVSSGPLTQVSIVGRAGLRRLFTWIESRGVAGDSGNDRRDGFGAIDMAACGGPCVDRAAKSVQVAQWSAGLNERPCDLLASDVDTKIEAVLHVFIRSRGTQEVLPCRELRVLRDDEQELVRGLRAIAVLGHDPMSALSGQKHPVSCFVRGQDPTFFFTARVARRGPPSTSPVMWRRIACATGDGARLDAIRAVPTRITLA